MLLYLFTKNITQSPEFGVYTASTAISARLWMCIAVIAIQLQKPGGGAAKANPEDRGCFSYDDGTGARVVRV